MTFAKPKQNIALPYAIQMRLDTMLAGAKTGLSGPEMVEYFSRLTPEIEQYTWSGGMPSRKQILQDCLARFPLEQQLKIIEDMLSENIYKKYEPPSNEDKSHILNWIMSQRNGHKEQISRRSVDLVFRERIDPTPSPAWDVFISHASEDKDDVARPLAMELINRGIRVWYDEYSLTIGDSLRKSIDKGLAQSKFGIVILSQAFFAKHWPQLELDGLYARETNGEKVILPIWHGIDQPDIRAYSPLLADRLAASTSRGLSYAVDQLMKVIKPGAA